MQNALPINTLALWNDCIHWFSHWHRHEANDGEND